MLTRGFTSVFNHNLEVLVFSVELTLFRKSVAVLVALHCSFKQNCGWLWFEFWPLFYIGLFSSGGTSLRHVSSCMSMLVTTSSSSGFIPYVSSWQLLRRDELRLQRILQYVQEISVYRTHAAMAFSRTEKGPRNLLTPNLIAIEI